MAKCQEIEQNFAFSRAPGLKLNFYEPHVDMPYGKILYNNCVEIFFFWKYVERKIPGS